MTKKRKIFSILGLVIGAVLACYLLSLVFIVLFGGVFTSLKNPNGGGNYIWGNEFGLPKGAIWEWEWANFPSVLSKLRVILKNDTRQWSVNFIGMVINTVTYTLGGAVISTMTPCLVAYAVAKCKFKFNAVIEFIVIMAMAVPVIGAYPSEIQVLKTLNLYDTWLGAAIQKMNFLGVYFLVFLATFRGISDSYAEAAYIEGAGEYRVMFTIMLPLAKNLIMTVLLMLFVQYWNDYQYPLLYLYSKPTLAYGMYYLTHLNRDTETNNDPMKMAGSIMLFVPILILFTCFKDTLMQNLSLGGLKE